MDLLLALVCDDARATPEGKLDVHGIFNDLYAPGFPAKQDRMVLVLVLEWDRRDAGRFKFRVDLMGPGGRPSFTVDGHTDVDERAPGQPPARTRLLMPLEEIVFPEEGAYRFVVRVKGRELRGPSLYLVRSEPRGEPFASGEGSEDIRDDGGAGGSPRESAGAPADGKDA